MEKGPPEVEHLAEEVGAEGCCVGTSWREGVWFWFGVVAEQEGGMVGGSGEGLWCEAERVRVEREYLRRSSALCLLPRALDLSEMPAVRA